MSEIDNFNKEFQRHFEEETIEFFKAYRVEEGERVFNRMKPLDPPAPDAELSGETRVVGVEETRAVDPDDARVESWTYYLGGQVRDVLCRYARGGNVFVSGDFPEVTMEDRHRLASALDTAIKSCGRHREPPALGL